MKNRLAVVAIAVCCAFPLGAQGVEQTAGRAAGRGGVPRQQGNARALLEQRLQERVNEIVRTRLALSDEQFQQLRQLSVRVEADKRGLRRDEVETRVQLRRELLAGDRVNETRVGELLDKLLGLERKRVDLMEAEQRDLARFLTPSQRARYFSLQDELRRSMQDMQRRRLGGARDEEMAVVPPPPALRRRFKGPPPPPSRQ